MGLIALRSLLILEIPLELPLFDRISHLQSLHDHPFCLGVRVIATVSVIEGVCLSAWVSVCEFESPVRVKVHATTPSIKTSYKSAYNSITNYNSYPPPPGFWTFCQPGGIVIWSLGYFRQNWHLKTLIECIWEK